MGLGALAQQDHGPDRCRQHGRRAARRPRHVPRPPGLDRPRPRRRADPRDARLRRHGDRGPACRPPHRPPAAARRAARRLGFGRQAGMRPALRAVTWPESDGGTRR
jgi:hypothetical protein